MHLESDQVEFDPASFSVREREVVDMAVLGHTDEQIAQALDISTSTVNSYWVRIRGKIGQLSRTEIVAKMLHTGYHDEQARQAAEIDRLTRLLADSNAELAGARRQIEASEGVEWYLLGLHFASEAMLIVNERAEIFYGNLQAERLFAAEPGALIGRALWELTDARGRERRVDLMKELTEGERATRMAIGVREPCYVQDTEGGERRVTMVLERFEANGATMVIATVKEFLADVEELVRSLRKPVVLQ